MTSLRVLQQIYLSDVNLSRFAQIVVHNVVNQHLVDESNRELVTAGVDSYCLKWFRLCADSCIFHNIILSG